MRASRSWYADAFGYLAWLELAAYEDPRPAPWPDGYRISVELMYHYESADAFAGFVPEDA